MRRALLVPAVAVLLHSTPARAECMGSCADAMLGALVGLLIYGVLGLVVLIMLIRAKWRKAGLRLLLASVLIALGVPLLSQGWLAWRHHAMTGHEVAGQPPALEGLVPLLVDDGYYVCGYGPCALALSRLGAAGAYGLPMAALEGLDLTVPIPLTDLPLELWQPPAEGSTDTRVRPLSPLERKVAAARIDYLILTRQVYSLSGAGPVEVALRQTALADAVDGALVTLVMAPLSGGKLALTVLDFDVLDLWLSTRALALPLAPYNTQSAPNRTASGVALIPALCPPESVMPQWRCQDELN